MKIICHPITVLAFVALPLIVSSIQRAGHEVGHLLDWRLAASHYAAEGLLLACVVIVCCVRYHRTTDFIYTLISGAAVIVYLGAQVFDEYPADYKLWTYTIPTVMLWVLVGTTTALVFTSRRQTA